MARKIEVEHTWKAGMWDWPLQHHDGVVKIHNDLEKFEVALETRFFTPKEIQVQVIEDKICIVCNHDERTDAHGTISRSVMRNYQIPDDVDPHSIKSRLTENGLLVITGHKKK